MLNCITTEHDRTVAVNSVIKSEFCGAPPVLYAVVNHLKTYHGKIISCIEFYLEMDSKQVFMEKHIL